MSNKEESDEAVRDAVVQDGIYTTEWQAINSKRNRQPRQAHGNSYTYDNSTIITTAHTCNGSRPQGTSSGVNCSSHVTCPIGSHRHSSTSACRCAHNWSMSSALLAEIDPAPARRPHEWSLDGGRRVGGDVPTSGTPASKIVLMAVTSVFHHRFTSFL